MKPSDMAMAECEQGIQSWKVWLRQRRRAAPRLELRVAACGCQVAVPTIGDPYVCCPVHCVRVSCGGHPAPFRGGR